MQNRRKAIWTTGTFEDRKDIKVWVHGFFEFRDRDEAGVVMVLEEHETGRVMTIDPCVESIRFEEWVDA